MRYEGDLITLFYDDHNLKKVFENHGISINASGEFLVEVFNSDKPKLGNPKIANAIVDFHLRYSYKNYGCQRYDNISYLEGLYLRDNEIRKYVREFVYELVMESLVDMGYGIHDMMKKTDLYTDEIIENMSPSSLRLTPHIMGLEEWETAMILTTDLDDSLSKGEFEYTIDYMSSLVDEHDEFTQDASSIKTKHTPAFFTQDTINYGYLLTNDAQITIDRNDELVLISLDNKDRIEHVGNEYRLLKTTSFYPAIPIDWLPYQ